MKILISTDMEGISGVVDWTHVDSTHAEYNRFRRLMTADVNAAVRGALKGGADQVVVTDAHGSKTNILIEELEASARLNSGKSGPMGMVQGIDNHVDAAFFVGYHACNGTLDGILSHTISGKAIANIWVNDMLVGEFGINALVAGAYNVPVLLVTSDQAGEAEAKDLVPDITAVVTKVSTSRFSADCLPPKRVHQMIEAAAEAAVKAFASGKAPAVLKTVEPVVVKIEFMHSAMADSASLLPNARRLEGRMIELKADTMPEAYRNIRAAVKMAA